MMRPPIGSVVLSFGDGLVRLFPRVQIPYRLCESNGLQLNADKQGEYWVNDDSSFFSLQGDSIVGATGWLYIEAVLQRYTLTRAKLYYDDGTGFSSDKYFAIPVTRRGYVREVIFLPPGIVGLRWAPIDSPGFFIQHSFSITRITHLEASLRALYRVLYDFNRFFRVAERRSQVVCNLLLPLLSFKLFSAYHNTIDFRVFDATSRSCDELWHDYQVSLAKFLPLLSESSERQEQKPLVSIVVVVDRGLTDWLETLVSSLLSQIYKNWELLVCTELSGFEVGIGVSDERISFGYADVATALNSIKGEFVVFLESHTVLQPQALYRLIQAFNSTKAAVVYCDTVIIDPESGIIISFDCRPQFSPCLLSHCHYIADLIAYDRNSIQGRLQNVSGSILQMTLQTLLSEDRANLKVAHIAEFLCLKPLNFTRNIELNSLSVSRPVSETKVAIIIPTKNAVELVQQCIESLIRTIAADVVNYRIILVDHASDDPVALQYFNLLSEQHCVLRYAGDFNFSIINNWAVGQLSEDYTHYLFCNNDIEAIHNGWLETMLGFGQMSDVGVVGAQLLYPDKLHIQHAGVCVGLHGLAEHYGKFLSIDDRYYGLLHADAQRALTCPHEVSAVTAACMLVRRDAFESVGGFDNAFAVGFGDVDLCLRVGKAGYRIVYSPESTLVHHESATRGKVGGDPHPSDTTLFIKRWQNLIDEGDPYYHPAYSRYSFDWQYVDPIPLSLQVKIRMNADQDHHGEEIG